MNRTMYKSLEDSINSFEVRDFLQYFATNFFPDLHQYFTVTRDYQPLHNEIILYCARFGQANAFRDNFQFLSNTHKMYFTVALFYTALLPQAVGVVCGEKVLQHFHKLSGTPWINCGMHGLASPILIVKESDLFDVMRTPECMALLEELMPVMRQFLFSMLFGGFRRRGTRSDEIVRFEAAPRAEEIWAACEEHIEALHRHVADPTRGFPMKFFHDF